MPITQAQHDKLTNHLLTFIKNLSHAGIENLSGVNILALVQGAFESFKLDNPGYTHLNSLTFAQYLRLDYNKCEQPHPSERNRRYAPLLHRIASSPDLNHKPLFIKLLLMGIQKLKDRLRLVEGEDYSGKNLFQIIIESIPQDSAYELIDNFVEDHSEITNGFNWSKSSRSVTPEMKSWGEIFLPLLKQLLKSSEKDSNLKNLIQCQIDQILQYSLSELCALYELKPNIDPSEEKDRKNRIKARKNRIKARNNACVSIEHGAQIIKKLTGMLKTLLPKELDCIEDLINYVKENYAEVEKNKSKREKAVAFYVLLHELKTFKEAKGKDELEKAHPEFLASEEYKILNQGEASKKVTASRLLFDITFLIIYHSKGFEETKTDSSNPIKKYYTDTLGTKTSWGDFFRSQPKKELKENINRLLKQLWDGSGTECKDDSLELQEIKPQSSPIS